MIGDLEIVDIFSNEMTVSSDFITLCSWERNPVKAIQLVLLNSVFSTL